MLGYRWINSVIKLNVTQGEYDPIKPYKSAHEMNVEGCGFIVDIEIGLIITTAEVVKNALSILATSFRTGKRSLSLELLSICYQRNVALCKINHQDVEIIIRGLDKKEIKNLNFIFCDSMLTNIGDEMVMIGYRDSIEFISTNVLSLLYSTVSIL